MDLFRKKSVDQLVSESTPLKRTLKTFDLTMLGIGAIIGTGIFVLTGKGALTAGPALCVSFLLAAVCCGFAGLCYAEFAAMAPVSGSAYSYAYLAFGELIAFVIGWDLILEYALQAATVSAGWSGYFNKLLEGFGLHLPVELTAAYGTFRMVEDNITFTPEQKSYVDRVIFVERRLPDFGKPVSRVSYEDGCKVYFADNSFVICRFSGTEPLLRIFAEASDEAAARGFVTAFRELLALE